MSEPRDRAVRDEEPTSDFPLPRRRSSRPPTATGSSAREHEEMDERLAEARAHEESASPLREASDEASAMEAAPWLGWGGTPFGMFHPPPSEPIEAYGGRGEAPQEPVDRERIREAILEVLRTVYDPEIPVNIVELGLIYAVEVSEEGKVEVEMTLTAPGCPVAGQLVEEVAQKAGDVPGVAVSHVKLVWDPPWTPERMSEAARLELGFF